MADPLTAIGAAAAVLDLAKVAWKLGSALNKLYRDTKHVDDTVEKLAGEVKSLGNECDLVHAELEDVVNATKNGEISPYDIDGRLWKCLTTKVEDCKQTIQTLNSVLDDIADKASGFIGQAQRQMRLNKNHDTLERIRVRVRTHTDGLRTTLLVINIKVAHLAPGNANRELSEKLDALQDMVNLLQKSMKGTSHASVSNDDITLVQCAREVITQGSTVYEASLAAPSVVGGYGAANGNIRVAQWVGAIDALRREEMASDHSDNRSNLPSVFSGEDGDNSMTEATSTHHEAVERDVGDKPSSVEDNSDDELAIDLAVAALGASTRAFEASSWQEADSLLQETLRLVQLLSQTQRGFCDMFELQYRLAVCAFHSQKSEDAEAALNSLLQQMPASDTQRGLVCEGAQLLSLLYVRTDDMERARSSCAKALQARRRLFGKKDDATVASMALMVRIYQLLDNHTLAKVYLIMIPEDRKPEILASIDGLLGVDPERFKDSTTLARSLSEDSALESSLSRIGLTRSGSESTAALSMKVDEASPSISSTSVLPRDNPGLATASVPKSLAHTSRRGGEDVDRSTDTRSGETSNARLTGGSSELDAQDQSEPSDCSTAGPVILTEGPVDESSRALVVETGTKPGPSNEQAPLGLPRNTILSNLGLEPQTPLDVAICNGSEEEELIRLLAEHCRQPSRIRRIFKSRPSPLHYAALLGEVDIARRILNTSNPEIIEKLITATASIWFDGSPFQWAISSLQAEVINLFLKARPSSLETFAKDFNMPLDVYKRWMKRTFSEAERVHGSYIPDRFIAMAKVLLEHGWHIDRAMGIKQCTLLHYATFLDRDYDPNGAMAAFLCERGADSRKFGRYHYTPYDLAERLSNNRLLQLFKSFEQRKQEEACKD